MIDGEEIYNYIFNAKVIIPKNISEWTILQKILWILKTSKDNSPAKALSPEAITYLAYRLFEEQIPKKSVLNTIARAGKTIMKNNGFYEITRQGREKLNSIQEENEEEITEKIYEIGERFNFHSDLKEIISKANKEIFIIDSYIDESLLEMYLKIFVEEKKLVTIKILTNSNTPKGNFIKISHSFQSQYKGIFETREIDSIHDRGIFIDNKEGWVMGQSIKDSAKNKPAYLIKLQNPQKLESVYQKIWSSASKIK